MKTIITTIQAGLTIVILLRIDMPNLAAIAALIFAFILYRIGSPDYVERERKRLANDKEFTNDIAAFSDAVHFIVAMEKFWCQY